MLSLKHTQFRSKFRVAIFKFPTLASLFMLALLTINNVGGSLKCLTLVVGKIPYLFVKEICGSS